MTKSTKSKKTPPTDGLRVIGTRQLKALTKRAYWRGVNAVHRDLTIAVEEHDRLSDNFETWWRSNG